MDYPTHGVFSDDLDLLALEPDVFEDFARRSMRLTIGGGNVSNAEFTATSFTAGAPNFTQARVYAGMTIKLGGASAGWFQIQTVFSGTLLGVTPLSSSSIVPGTSFGFGGSWVGTEAGISFEVYTLSGLARKVAADWSRRLGIDPYSATDVLRLVNPEALRMASAMRVLSLLFLARADSGAEAAAGVEDFVPGRWRGAAALYSAEAGRLLLSTKLQITGSDGSVREMQLRDRVPYRC